MKERTKHIVVKIKGCCFFVKRLLSNTDSHFQTGKEKKKKKLLFSGKNARISLILDLTSVITALVIIK